MKAPQDEIPRSRLGRGLAALIGDSGSEGEAIVRARGQKRVPIEFLHRNPNNPRTIFNEDDLQELTDSIREKGIIQPILVRTMPGKADAYEIIAGERRWRAAQRAELHDVPIVTIEADDKQALEIAIIENVQRANLNALEEALGYERLGAEFGYSQEDLAKVIGKSRPHVANTLRLLRLPEHARSLLANGQITAGHARALLTSTDPDKLAQKVVEKGMSVRDVERAVQREDQDDTKPRRANKDADTRALEKRISDRIGLTVELTHKGEQGDVRIRYKSLEQLDRIVALLEG
jgi:ParB family transcriptional regulator, chromosome partitioning protein